MEPWGAVTQVRRHKDGRIRYCVAPFDPDGVGTLFDECDLVPTGGCSTASQFTSFGEFRTRDIVKVRGSTASAEITGKLGTVIGGSRAGGSLAVWINDLLEVWSIQPSDLESTGRREQRERSTNSTSLQVSKAGDVLGYDDYEVLEDIADFE